MTGLQPRPSGTLVERAMGYLGSGPAHSSSIARDVLGLGAVPEVVAERIAVALLGSHPRIGRLPDMRWHLVRHTAGSPALDEVSFAVVDVETTGTSPRRGDRVVEIAIVSLAGGEVKPVFESLVNPERPIPPFTRSLTRITDEMVRDRPVFAEIAEQVVAALAGRVFVAHNVRFDWAFVTAEVRRALHLELDGPKMCTVRLARRFASGLRRRSLDSLSTHFGVENHARHRAGGDALATAGVLKRLLELARDQGARTLDDLGRLDGRRRKKRRSKLPRPMEEL